MTRLLIALTLIICGGTTVFAQEPVKQNGPAITIVAQPTAEQKARIATLAKAWEQKARDADAARDKYMIELLATLAELGLKPSETSVSWNDKGEPVFGRIEPAPKEAAKTTPKPENKP